jgi:hypothetical protein
MCRFDDRSDRPWGSRPIPCLLDRGYEVRATVQDVVAAAKLAARPCGGAASSSADAGQAFQLRRPRAGALGIGTPAIS